MTLSTLNERPAGQSMRWWRGRAALVLAGGLPQLLVLLLTYGKLLFHPGRYLIIDHYDGIKTYYSLATFLRQPLREGLPQHGQNYLNPFLWLHKLTDRITQFRALGRFIWPFWWAVVLGFAWYAGHAWRPARARRVRWLQALWVVLAGLGVVDMLNATHHYATITQRDNLLAEPATQEVRMLVGWPATSRYQALLTLPFYHSGSETVDNEPFYGLDPDDPHCDRTYQLGMVTGLPLMAHEATRTPGYQARELMSMFRPEGPDPALLNRLDSRPILVYLDSAYYDGGNNYYRDVL